jgi:hypothetical protein
LLKKKQVNLAQSEGGRRGAESRWAKVSKKKRSDLMRAAARARWGPKKKKGPKNIAASRLAKLRWANMTPEQRRRTMEKVWKGRLKSALKRSAKRPKP